MAHKKTTSKRIATRASKLLRTKKTLKRIKSVAGSALSQKHGESKRKKGKGRKKR